MYPRTNFISRVALSREHKDESYSPHETGELTRVVHYNSPVSIGPSHKQGQVNDLRINQTKK